MSEYIIDTTNLKPLHMKEVLELWWCGEEIIRCRDCVWFTPEYEYQEELDYGVYETMVEPSNCGNPKRCCETYDSISKKTVPVHIDTEPDGFCKWACRKSDKE